MDFKITYANGEVRTITMPDNATLEEVTEEAKKYGEIKLIE